MIIKQYQSSLSFNQYKSRLFFNLKKHIRPDAPKIEGVTVS